jgi:hypothetical protein
MSTGLQRSRRRASLQVEDSQIETAAGQIGREVFAEIPQSDEAVTQIQFLNDAMGAITLTR